MKTVHDFIGEELVKLMQFGVYWDKKNRVDKINFPLELVGIGEWEEQFHFFCDNFSNIPSCDYTLSKEESKEGLKDLYNIT